MSEAPGNLASIKPAGSKRVKGRDIPLFEFWVYEYETEVDLDGKPSKGLIKQVTGFFQAIQDFFE